MTGIYAELAATADELLTVGSETSGQSSATFVINIMRPSIVSGATQIDEPTITWTRTQVKAFQRGVSEQRDGATMFAAASKVVLIAATGVSPAPTIADKIEINGEEFAIINVEAIAAGEVTAIFRAYLAR